LSADGSEIAFDSIDSAINPTPSLFQTFAKDLDTGKITFLSRNKHGRPGNGFSYFPSVSANGHFVAFEGNATNLPIRPLSHPPLKAYHLTSWGRGTGEVLVEHR
jgi:hypothetical protein